MYTVKLDCVSNYCLNKYNSRFVRCKMLGIHDGKFTNIVTNIAGSIHCLGNIFCERYMYKSKWQFLANFTVAK